MNFIAIQSAVQALIAAHATFQADSAVTVLRDAGTARPLIEKALTEKGYALAVWPPVHGESFEIDPSGLQGVNVQIVVRFEINPKKLAEQDDPSAWVNQRLADAISAVLDADPDLGGVKFQMAKEPFTLMNFDEGVLAYHLRFQRFAVFG